MDNNLNEKYKKKKELRSYLINRGWQEVITYSLISSEMKEDFSINPQPLYQLAMPKTEHHKYYRLTPAPSHLKTLSYNLARGNENLFFFEISSVASPSQREELLILSGVGKLLNQPLHQLNQPIDFY